MDLKFQAIKITNFGKGIKLRRFSKNVKKLKNP